LFLVLAAHDGLVYLDLAREGSVEAVRVHGEPDAVGDEPRGLLGDAQVAGELVGAAALLAGRVEPDRGEPLGEWDGAVLEDRPLLDAELLAAVLAAPEGAGL
jgi:hypothetical protein